jgi:hypothetical protein
MFSVKIPDISIPLTVTYPQHRLTKVAGQWQRVRKARCFIQYFLTINREIDFSVAKTVPRQVTHTAMNNVLLLEVLQLEGLYESGIQRNFSVIQTSIMKPTE